MGHATHATHATLGTGVTEQKSSVQPYLPRQGVSGPQRKNRVARLVGQTAGFLGHREKNRVAQIAFSGDRGFLGHRAKNRVALPLTSRLGPPRPRLLNPRRMFSRSRSLFLYPTCAQVHFTSVRMTEDPSRLPMLVLHFWQLCLLFLRTRGYLPVYLTHLLSYFAT